VLAVPALTQVRVVVGVAALLAVAAVFALGLGTLFRRTWVAILVAISAVVLPHVLGALPLLPDGVSEWLLRLTPAAGFAVQQTIREYPQVVAHYAPSAGYFPLPWWAGFTVLCGYAAVVLGLGMTRPRRSATSGSPAPWR
jgi:predicted cobalt transporter CbtA